MHNSRIVVRVSHLFYTCKQDMFTTLQTACLPSFAANYLPDVFSATHPHSVVGAVCSRVTLPWGKLKVVVFQRRAGSVQQLCLHAHAINRRNRRRHATRLAVERGTLLKTTTFQKSTSTQRYGGWGQERVSNKLVWVVSRKSRCIGQTNTNKDADCKDRPPHQKNNTCGFRPSFGAMASCARRIKAPDFGLSLQSLLLPLPFDTSSFVVSAWISDASWFLVLRGKQSLFAKQMMTQRRSAVRHKLSPVHIRRTDFPPAPNLHTGGNCKAAQFLGATVLLSRLAGSPLAQASAMIYLGYTCMGSGMPSHQPLLTVSTVQKTEKIIQRRPTPSPLHTADTHRQNKMKKCGSPVFMYNAGPLRLCAE